MRFKRRRLWLVGFTPGRLLLGVLILGPLAMIYFHQWRWVPPVFLVYALAVSFHVASFTTSAPLIFRYYIGPFRECRAELESLHLEPMVGDDAPRRPYDHIQVGPDMGVATFPCRRPAETIAWIEAGMASAEIPTATVLPKDGKA